MELVEPTEADTLLAGHFVMQTDARGIGAARMAQEWSRLIRQHVAAEVARETAELRAQAKFLGSQLENVRIGMGWASIHATAHKSSPPPPAP